MNWILVQSLPRCQVGRRHLFAETHIFAYKGNRMSRRAFMMMRGQRSLCASAHNGDYRQIVALQGLSDKPYTSAPCPVWTLFLRPVSVEERARGQQGSDKQDNKNTHNVHWSEIKMWNMFLKLTRMTLCRMSSAWLSAFCSLAIRLWCKVSLKEPIKNWETSWTDQESGRSWMTFSTAKTRGLLLSRSTATLRRSLELR